MKRRCVFALSCAPVVLVLVSPVQAQQYAPGYEWNRTANWVAGTTPGSTIGNPQPDGEGAGVWQYEWVEGGGIGSANEWFAQPSHLMVWDDNWWNIGSGGAWVNSDELNPPIFNNRMTHNLHDTSSSAIPMVRWINPVGNGTVVDIAGVLNVTWSGHEFFGVPVATDVVIAHNDFSTGITSLLYSDTLLKPSPFPSIGDSVDVPISIRGVVMDEGDSILISLRGQRDFAGDGRWVILEDAISITLIPAPGAAALLGMGGLIALRRRRR